MTMDPFAITSLALSGASLLQGAVRGAKAKKLYGQYNQMESAIPMQDPLEVSYMDENRRRQAAFEAGTDPMTGYVTQQARNFGLTTQANIVRAGGNASSLLQAQAGVNNGVAQAGAFGASRGAQLFGQRGQMASAMANRRYNRELSRANRTWSEYARAKEDSVAATQAGLTMLPDFAIGKSNRAAAPYSGQTFDPLAATSPGMGSFYPGAYNAGDLADPEHMDTIGASQLSRTPRY